MIDCTGGVDDIDTGDTHAHVQQFVTVYSDTGNQAAVAGGQIGKFTMFEELAAVLQEAMVGVL